MVLINQCRININWSKKKSLENFADFQETAFIELLNFKNELKRKII